MMSRFRTKIAGKNTCSRLPRRRCLLVRLRLGTTNEERQRTRPRTARGRRGETTMTGMCLPLGLCRCPRPCVRLARCPTKGARIRGQAHGLGLPIWFFLFVAGFSSLESKAGPGSDRMPDFEVTGLVTMTSKALESGGRRSEFTVSVSGLRWFIRLRPMSWPPRQAPGRQIPSPVLYELASDGTHTYEVKSYDPKDFPPPSIPRSAERWLGVTPGPRASLHEAYALWYAFASSGYWPTIRSDMLPALAPPLAEVRGTLETNRSFPFLPKSVVLTDPGTKDTWRFTALSFTNIDGLALPLQAVAAYPMPSQPVPRWEVRIEGRTFRPSSSHTDFMPILQGKEAVVYDSTFDRSDPRFVARMQTNHWPATNQVYSLYKAKRSSAEATIPPTRKRVVVLLALVSLTVLGAITLILHRTNKQHTNKSNV